MHSTVPVLKRFKAKNLVEIMYTFKVDLMDRNRSIYGSSRQKHETVTNDDCWNVELVC